MDFHYGGLWVKFNPGTLAVIKEKHLEPTVGTSTTTHVSSIDRHSYRIIGYYNH